MNLIDRDMTLHALKARADISGGLTKTTFERAISIVEGLPTVDAEEKKEAPQWKSARPKRKGWYLCYMVVASAEWYEVCQYEGKGAWSDLQDNDASGEVAFWMELPSKPYV